MAFEAFIHFGPLFPRKTKDEIFAETILTSPQVYMRPKIDELLPRDLKNLNHDLYKWIARDSKKSDFVAQQAFNLGSFDIFSIDVPRIAADCVEHSEMHVVKLPNDGRILCDEIYSMVKHEIASGNEVYFRRYHNLICSKFCKSRQECIRHRERWNAKLNVSKF